MLALIASLISIPLFILILFLSAREIARYRKDQRTRSELYPYSRRRIVLRCTVSACLIVEVFLLFWGPLLFRHQKPEWFLVYIVAVLLVTMLMVVLALLDWKESRFLEKVSQKRLLAELIEDIKRGPQTPDIH